MFEYHHYMGLLHVFILEPSFLEFITSHIDILNFITRYSFSIDSKSKGGFGVRVYPPLFSIAQKNKGSYQHNLACIDLLIHLVYNLNMHFFWRGGGRSSRPLQRISLQSPQGRPPSPPYVTFLVITDKSLGNVHYMTLNGCLPPRHPPQSWSHPWLSSRILELETFFSEMYLYRFNPTFIIAGSTPS